MHLLRAFFDLRRLENQTLLAVLLAVVLGLIFPQISQYLKPFGDIFLRLLKSVAVPLVVASVFVSIVSLGSLRELKELGIKTVLYYITTTFLAVLTGLVVVNLFFHSPEGVSTVSKAAEGFQPKTVSLEEFFVSFFPDNIFKALAEGKVIQIIVFTILFAFGVLAVKNTEGGKTVERFLSGVNDALLKLAGWIIKLTPVGVFAIVYHTVALHGLSAFAELWKYALAVLVGLFWHAVVNLGLIAYRKSARKPFALAKG